MWWPGVDFGYPAQKTPFNFLVFSNPSGKSMITMCFALGRVFHLFSQPMHNTMWPMVPVFWPVHSSEDGPYHPFPHPRHASLVPAPYQISLTPKIHRELFPFCGPHTPFVPRPRQLPRWEGGGSCCWPEQTGFGQSGSPNGPGSKVKGIGRSDKGYIAFETLFSGVPQPCFVGCPRMKNIRGVRRSHGHAPLSLCANFLISLWILNLNALNLKKWPT